MMHKEWYLLLKRIVTEGKTIYETVTGGLNFTILLGISDDGDYVLKVKDFSTDTAAFISSNYSAIGFVERFQRNVKTSQQIKAKYRRMFTYVLSC